MEPDRAQPKKSPSCPRCGNRLRLRADQIGTEVKCPKCQSTFMVGRPGSQRATTSSGSSPEDDAYEPEIPLVPSSIVPPEEMIDVGPTAVTQPSYAADWSTADELEAEAPHQRPPVELDHLAVAKAQGILRTRTVVETPKWTFFSGVFAYLWQGVNLTHWIAMSFGLSVSGILSLTTAQYLGLGGGGLTNLAAMGVPLMMLTIGLALATLAYCVASCLAVIQETADGHNEPQASSMAEWNEWIFLLLSVVSLWAASCALGYPLSMVEAIGPAAFLVCGFFVFPVLLLSALESESFFMPFSPPVLATLVRYWQVWLMFYLLTISTFAGWCFAMDWGIAQAPYMTVLLNGPVLAAMMLLDARWLGRLVWRASGAPAVPREDQAEGRMAGVKASKKRKKRRRIQIEFTDDFALPPANDDAPSLLAPPIEFPRRR
jgi:predicted Zn finger-like uncharacterized protein